VQYLGLFLQVAQTHSLYLLGNLPIIMRPSIGAALSVAPVRPSSVCPSVMRLRISQNVEAMKTSNLVQI